MGRPRNWSRCARLPCQGSPPRRPDTFSLAAAERPPSLSLLFRTAETRLLRSRTQGHAERLHGFVGLQGYVLFACLRDPFDTLVKAPNDQGVQVRTPAPPCSALLCPRRYSRFCWNRRTDAAAC